MNTAPTDDFNRQTDLLRASLLKWESSIREQWSMSLRPSSSVLQSTSGFPPVPPPLDWSFHLGKLTSLQSQLARLHDSVDPVLRHFVYVPVRATSDPRDVKTFLASSVASAAAGTDDAVSEGEEGEGGERGEGEGNDKTKEDPVETLIQMQRAVEEVVEHFVQHKERF